MNLVNTHIIKDGENHYPNYNGIYNLTIAPSEDFIIYYTNKYASYFGDSDKGKIDTIRLSTMTTTLEYAHKEQQ